MITADNITTQTTVDAFHALATATDKARSLMRDAQDGSVDPVMAANRINVIMANLKAELEGLS